MSPEWMCPLNRVGPGFVNNKPTKFVLFCLGICCSRYYKQLGNVQKVMVTYLCDIVFSQVQYVDLCDIGCVHSTYQPSLWSVTF